MSPSSAAIVYASTPADPGDREQERHVAMVGAESPQLTLAVGELALELVDQPQARLDRSLPRLRQPEPDEQLATAHTEEIGDRTRLAVREQDRVHALLQARAVTHQVEPPARAFALGTHLRVGQPDRRHQ